MNCISWRQKRYDLSLGDLLVTGTNVPCSWAGRSSQSIYHMSQQHNPCPKRPRVCLLSSFTTHVDSCIIPHSNGTGARTNSSKGRSDNIAVHTGFVELGYITTIVHLSGVSIGATPRRLPVLKIPKSKSPFLLWFLWRNIPVRQHTNLRLWSLQVIDVEVLPNTACPTLPCPKCSVI